MSSSVLHPLKKKPRVQKLASFDVETADEDNNFFMVGLYYGEKFKAFYSIDSFYNFLSTNLRGYWLIATNLGFDLTACFMKSKYWNEFDIVENGGFMLLAENKTLNIRFIDTLNWHKASVKQLGEIVNINKLPHPEFLGKRKPETEQEIRQLRDYNMIDCKISLKFSEWFQNQIISMGGELKITIASTSLDIWKRNYNKQILVKEDHILRKRGINVNVKDKIFKAYYGGRTETIQRGHFKERLYYYDFNSLYPSVMVNALPHPNSVIYREKGSIKDIYTKHGVSLVMIEHLSNELPLLPVRHNGKLTFPSGLFTGWYTHLEIRKAVENGYKLHNVYETISYSHTFFPFKDYIENLYSKRLKAKKHGGNEQLIFKLLMNSLYGKFGERTHQIVKHFDLKTLNPKLEEELNKIDTEKFIFNDNGLGYATWKEECNSSHVFPILPVHITALARIKLWEKAKTLEPVYMDTDSIITKQKIPFSNKLGELDLEYTLNSGIFVKPKMYLMETDKGSIVKMKGVPHATKEQFLKVLNNESISYTKFVKLKEGIRRKLKVNSVINISKHLDLEDNKREWGSNFSFITERSKPIKLTEELENGLFKIQETQNGVTTDGYVRV